MASSSVPAASHRPGLSSEAAFVEVHVRNARLTDLAAAMRLLRATTRSGYRARRRGLPAQPALHSLGDGRRRGGRATSGGRGSHLHQAIGAIGPVRRRDRRAGTRSGSRWTPPTGARLPTISSSTSPRRQETRAARAWRYPSRWHPLNRRSGSDTGSRAAAETLGRTIRLSDPHPRRPYQINRRRAQP